MSESKILEQGSRVIERSASADALLAKADVIVSKWFKKLIPEKARQVAQKVTKPVLLTTSALSILVTSGCGNTRGIEPQITPEPTPLSTPFIPEPTEIPTQPEYNYIYASGLIKIAIDKDGLPANYISADGIEIKFDKAEMQKLKEKAILNQEPEVITILSLPINETVNPNYLTSYSDKHPRVPELPEDVLSDEELQKRGVTIEQSRKTKLHIRESAFEAGGPLAYFNDAVQKKLTIVLVDGPRVSRYFIDDQNQPFLRLLPPPDIAAINVYRSKKIVEWEEVIKTYKLGHPADDEQLWLKAEVYNYQKGLTDKEIVAEMMLNEGADTVGRHIYEYDYERDSNEKQINSTLNKRTTIFIAVGENQSENKREVLAFDRNGKIVNHVFWAQHELYNQSPQAKETHPNPAEIKSKSENLYGYLYESSGPGFTLEHEIGHHIANLNGVNNERNADTIAAEIIRKAWEEWEKSNYTNNKKFPFTFSLRPDQGGGYILTRKEKNRQKKFRKKLRAKNLKDLRLVEKT